MKLMDLAHKIEVSLVHPVEVSRAANCLVHELECDSWFVACRREHLYVLHLNQGGEHKFAVSFECTSPVDKGIYHDPKAWSLRITPLHSEDSLSEARILQIKAGLAELN
jgi:hypothetical protein